MAWDSTSPASAEPSLYNCRTCKNPKPETDFYVYLSRTDKPYRYPDCRDCTCKKQYKGERNNQERYDKKLARQCQVSRLERKDSTKTAKYIFRDSKGCDRKAGYINNLTIPLIENLIQYGCCYCGETTLRMTLDRLDNTRGHTTDNVVPACLRCNYLRRDMPYAAWYSLLPAIRNAKELGLFGSWTGRART